MQTRLRIATATGAGLFLIGGPGIALAASAAAAPAPTPSPTAPGVAASPVPLPTRPGVTVTLPNVVVPSAAPTRTSPGQPPTIDVPAGNAKATPGSSGDTPVVIALAATGVLLVAGGGITVTAVRRRR